MTNYPVHPLLAHLSKEQINELTARFYSREPIPDLLNFYRIDCPASQLYKILPPEIGSDRCPNCGENMILPRLSRHRFLLKLRNNFRCSRCRHKEGKWCPCQYCHQLRQETVRCPPISHPKQPSAKHEQVACLIQADDLTLEQAVSLVALARCCVSSGFNKEIRFDQFDMPLAPVGLYSDKLLSRLIDAALLRVMEQPDSFTQASFTRAMAVAYPLAIQWCLSDRTLQDLMSDIENRVDTDQWPGHWYAELSALVFDLAVAECVEFFDWCAKERNFPSVDEKSKSGLIRDLLKDFSVGYSYRAINSAAQYAADHLVTKACSPLQAANYMLISCQRWADKARIEKWNIKPLRRNINCPRSMMSHVLYETFLKIPNDEGFNMPIVEIVTQQFDYDLY